MINYRPPLLLTPDLPTRKYERGHGHVNLHWGQRKLLMSEIEFFMYEAPWNTPFHCVYAGAGPGIHIPFLSQLFPWVKFDLWDPAGFDKTLNGIPQISLFPEFFTDDVARSRYANETNLYFVSDIRRKVTINPSLTGEEIRETQAKNEIMVVEDMEMQANWHKIMVPVKSMFKFRLPFPGMIPEKEDTTFPYFSGRNYFGIWAPPHSTETRLVVNGMDIVNYDIVKHEQQMFYFNTTTRFENKYKPLIYPHEHITLLKIVESSRGHLTPLTMEHFVFQSFDFVSEQYILRDYLAYKENNGIPPNGTTFEHLLPEILKMQSQISRVLHGDFISKLKASYRKIHSEPD